MKRKALFVGVNEYQDAQIENLRYAVCDASEIQAQFKFCGFETKLLPDPARGDVEKWVEAMTSGLKAGDVFVFYFAGHGYTSPGGSDELLFCRDDKYADLQYNRAGIPFSMLRDQTLRNGQNSIFILDACRSNFFSGQRGKAPPRDLVSMSAMMGNPGSPRRRGAYAIWRSCGSGQSALELESLGHGIFTYAIDRVMTDCREKGRELAFGDDFLSQVYERMVETARANLCYAEQSYAEQKPETEKTVDWPRIVLIEGRKQTVSDASRPVTVTCPLCGSRNEEDATFRCRICGRDYLCKNHYDQSANCCSDCAEKMRVSQSDIPLSGGATSSSPASYPTAGTVKTLMLPGGAKLELVYCPPGTFWMGSENGEPGHCGKEIYHRVTLTKGFWLGKYPVTQGQWKSVMGNNPAKHTGNDALPVERVSWNNCQDFIKKVNTELHCGARLPTEAEWEYACRAGTTGPYGGTGKLDEMGWYGTFFGNTHPVGQKKANDWGLYDMHGNIEEWCSDWCGKYPAGDVTDPKGPASGFCRIVRGGGWYGDAKNCRSAYRYDYYPWSWGRGVGFRLCCSAGPCGS